jgi:hypothetical protein
VVFLLAQAAVTVGFILWSALSFMGGKHGVFSNGLLPKTTTNFDRGFENVIFHVTPTRHG